MDVITTAIVAAIDHGAASLARSSAAAHDAIVPTPGQDPRVELASDYSRLKTLLAASAPAGPELEGIVADLEIDPGSVSRQLLLSESLRSAQLDQREDVLALARSICSQVGGMAVRISRNAGPGGLSISGAAAPETPNYAVETIFFATDRNARPSPLPSQMFGSERAELRYGSCQVSIPRDHRLGELEERSLWRLQFRPDPGRHVVLLEAQVQDKSAFFSAVSARVKASSRQNAFVFVHGFNVSFEDAARRTGQMAYDLGFEGAPVFYSWPSRASVAGYLVDEGNIEWSQANLKSFLIEFLSQSGAQEVYLIAHSMGNRALSRAIAELLEEQPALAGKLAEIILTAPDIDAAVFTRDIAPVLVRAGRPVTLYASSDDIALAASKRMHGYARAGDSGKGLLVLRGIETIDATGVDTGFVKHAYFADNRSALSDIFYLIATGFRADQRFGLAHVDTAEGRYWTFKK
jgi:esterase/lipase superfamily enzyme